LINIILGNSLLYIQNIEYMNGATTEPCVKTIKVPMIKIVIIRGANQYFFRTFRKSHKSFTNSIKDAIFKKF